jgi:hypothetical protein
VRWRRPDGPELATGNGHGPELNDAARRRYNVAVAHQTGGRGGVAAGKPCGGTALRTKP